ncbi:hypothetical protein EXU57_02745 [Segetibacter sp. 3557_3]|uniref:hypothetical protein n=1 Tax=Segetibacter sp. 3557_3 TaxID=2547429 RepID=UPI001058EA02|nr:hypothetical protein [Segetibacter sp. 3557_3]TDH29009.1 hypothetical protein EXU57_02745 [Segetibacter sp. 3557_3]
MSSTIPFELNGSEYIAEAVSAKDPETNQVQYFVKINGDPACFINFSYSGASTLAEDSSSPELTPEFKEAMKKALLDYLAGSMAND